MRPTAVAETLTPMEPVTLSPELEALAAQPPSKPPSLGPADRLAEVPKSPTEYEITLPRTPRGQALLGSAESASRDA